MLPSRGPVLNPPPGATVDPLTIHHPHGRLIAEAYSTVACEWALDAILDCHSRIMRNHPPAPAPKRRAA